MVVDVRGRRRSVDDEIDNMCEELYDSKVAMASRMATHQFQLFTPLRHMGNDRGMLLVAYQHNIYAMIQGSPDELTRPEVQALVASTIDYYGKAVGWGEVEALPTMRGLQYSSSPIRYTKHPPTRKWVLVARGGLAI